MAKSRQLGLRHGQVEDSTAIVISLSPQMCWLINDAVVFLCIGDVVVCSRLNGNGLYKFNVLRPFKNLI